MATTTTPAPENPDDKAATHERIGRILEKRNAAIQIGSKILNDAFGLFGVETALVPIEKETKIPAKKNWQKTGLLMLTDVDDLSRLGKDERGTAVLLGAASQHLVALDFDKQEHGETFIRENPTITDTLTTHGNRGFTMWFIMTGEYPKSFDLRDPTGGNFIEFRADGRLAIFRGTHPSGNKYKVLNETKPRRIAYEDIKFPEGWKAPAIQGSGGEASPEVPAYEFMGRMLSSTFATSDRFGDAITVGPKGRITINQFAFADCFACSYPVSFVENVGFHVYDEGTGSWSITFDPEIYRRVGIFMEYLAREKGLNKIRNYRTVRFLGETTAILKGLIREKWSSEPSGLLHLGNGMLKLDGPQPELLPFSPTYRSLSAVPHQWIPDADCPRWKEFLANALPAEDIELLQKWCGLTVSGYNSAQAIMLLVGVGGAGKGVIVKVVSAIIGRKNCIEVRTRNLNDRFEMAMYYGKTLLFGSDVPGDFLTEKAAQRVKALTGHDELMAEFKYQPSAVSFLGTFNMVLASNQRLRVTLDGDEEAYRRRIKIIEFTKVPGQQIPDFAESIIAAETPGILRWMVDGLLKLRRDFAEQGTWMLTSAQQERIDEFLAESDSLRAFIKRCIAKADPEASLSSSDILLGYHEYCDDNGWAPQPVRNVQKMVPVLMLELYHVSPRHDLRFDGTSRRGYKGIRILRNPETES